MHAQGLCQTLLLELSPIRLLAPQPGFINALPAAEIGAAFIKGIIAGQMAACQSGVEIGAQHPVLLLVKSQAALQQFHFDDQLVNTHSFIVVLVEGIVNRA